MILGEFYEQRCTNSHEDSRHYHSDEGELDKPVSGEVDISQPSKQRLEEISHSLTDQVSESNLSNDCVIEENIRANHSHVHQSTTMNDQVSCSVSHCCCFLA